MQIYYIEKVLLEIISYVSTLARYTEWQQLQNNRQQNYSNVTACKTN